MKTSTPHSLSSSQAPSRRRNHLWTVVAAIGTHLKNLRIPQRPSAKSSLTIRAIVPKFIHSLFQHNPVLTIVFLGLPILTGTIPLFSSYLLKEFIDAVAVAILPGELRSVPRPVPWSELSYPLMMIVLMNLLGFAASWSQHFAQYVELRLKDTLGRTTALAFYAKLSRLSLPSLESADTQNKISLSREGMDWRPLEMIRQLPLLLSNFTVILASFVVTASLNSWLALVLLGSSVPYLLASLKSASVHFSITDVRSSKARLYGYFGWLLTEHGSINELKLMNAHEFIATRIRNLFDEFAAERRGFGTQRLLWFTGSSICRHFGMAVCVFYLAHQCLTGEISIGEFTLLLAALQQLSHGVLNGFSQAKELYENCIFLKPYFELMEFEDETTGGLSLPPRPFDIIEFDRVSFRYPGCTSEEYALNEVSFKIRRGTKTALVGLNGAGKSTLIKLLLRLYEPTSGTITIDGRDIATFNLKEWQSLFCVLFQTFNKYSLTAQENVCLCETSNADLKNYLEALESAQATEIIDKLPARHEQELTKHTESGTELSGGQWQKLALARAYYRRAPFLILDEPTSAIDSLSEEKIFKNVQQLDETHTVLLISHRFSTVRQAEQIIVLKNGTVSEAGSHEELLGNNSDYARLFQAQAQGYR